MISVLALCKTSQISSQQDTSTRTYTCTCKHMHLRPGSSTTTPSFLHTVHRWWGDANESWRIQSFPDVKVPPLLAVSLLTERAIWAAESRRQAHPSLCPALWACSQRDRLGELAGIRSPDLLAKLEHVLMILAFSWVENVND